MSKNRELLLEAIKDYKKEVILDGFTFKRPDAARLIEFRQRYKDIDKREPVEQWGLVMAAAMDPEDVKGISTGDLGLVVLARGGISGKFFQTIMFDVMGMDRLPVDPLDFPDGSESPSENSDSSAEPSS